MSWVFDGVNDRVTYDDHAALSLPNGDWTLAGWCKRVSAEGSQTQSAYLISWGAYNANPSFNFLVYCESHSGAANRVEAHPNGVTALSPSNLLFGEGVWQHCFIQRSGTTITVFIDNVQYASASLSAGTNVAGSWFFGARSDLAAERWLNGKLAEWAKWDRALTAQERGELAGGAFPEDYTTSLVWHSQMFDDFTESVAGLTVTATGAVTDDADHPIARGGGGPSPIPTPINTNIILMPGVPG